jgi:hypothetical protein
VFTLSESNDSRSDRSQTRSISSKSADLLADPTGTRTYIISMSVRIVAKGDYYFRHVLPSLLDVLILYIHILHAIGQISAKFVIVDLMKICRGILVLVEIGGKIRTLCMKT